ncbi:glycerophosphoryl diester phosphodiesterase [Salinibacter ruber]|uniref:glycerophosphodiester phosphodiesterase family protein n=1 Tax=Salinibacter ruber TaxID=146919 RepID=UPI002166D630|nr:glycerophosphodiester phosphodiesterase family protein [Salinibacter ruber]MCS4194193.1 glycerophosphoryl diester phosphodiesterase [Salinibacter ruber]
MTPALLLSLLATVGIGMPATAGAAPPPDSVAPPEAFDLQGHRGARGLAPENTIPAFRRALAIGVTTLEMDVVVSGDGAVVVSHEPWMNPDICTLPSGAPVPEDDARGHNLYQMPYADIKRYDCGRRQHPDFPRQASQPAVKPRLHDVIQMAEAYVAEHDRSPAFYNIEIKSRPKWDGTFHPEPKAFAQRVLEVVHERGIAAQATIQSFDERALRAARRLREDRDADTAVELALLVTDGTAEALPDQLDALGFVPAVYSPAHTAVDAGLLRAAHDRGLRVVPWTVNERDTMRRLIRLGVDGLITDYPDTGMDVVETMSVGE